MCRTLRLRLIQTVAWLTLLLCTGCLLHMWCHLWNTNMTVYCEDSLWLFWAILHVLCWWVFLVLNLLMWPHIFLVVSMDLVMWFVWSCGLESFICCLDWCYNLGALDVGVPLWIVHLLWHFFYLRGILCAHHTEPAWGVVSAVLGLKSL